MEVIDFFTAIVEVGVERTVSVKLRGLEDSSQVAFFGVLGWNLPKAKAEIYRELDTLIVGWSKVVNLEIKHILLSEGHRYDIKWEVTDRSLSILKDSISMEHARWYGCGQRDELMWPMEKWRRGQYAMTSSSESVPSVHERYWLSSRGVAVFVDERVPLFVSSNKGGDHKLVLMAKWGDYYENVDDEPLKLRYSVLQGKDMVAAHKFTINNFCTEGEEVPNKNFFYGPVWSTERVYGRDVTQDKVLALAKEIRKRGIPVSQLDIGHGWMSTDVYLTFDPKRFPDPVAMVDELREMGFLVNLAVAPFAASSVKTTAPGAFWVKTGIFPGYSLWQGTISRVLDVTNPEAVTWFLSCLQDLKAKIGISSFHFDGGEGSYLPHFARTTEKLRSPSEFTRKLCELAADRDPDHLQSVSFAHRTHNCALAINVGNINSTWSKESGIGSLIPRALTMSLMGYPFFSLDYIGGDILPTSRNCDRELYARWLQICALMPIMRFSIPPWDYDDELFFITDRMIRSRQEYSDEILSLVDDWALTGDPLIRPLWWIAPRDEVALVIDSEFLLGDNILVAPIVEKGALMRDVYLPEGYWKDVMRNRIVNGKKWLKKYLVSISELPIFLRLTQADVDEVERERMANLQVDIQMANSSELLNAGYPLSGTPDILDSPMDSPAIQRALKGSRSGTAGSMASRSSTNPWSPDAASEATEKTVVDPDSIPRIGRKRSEPVGQEDLEKIMDVFKSRQPELTGIHQEASPDIQRKNKNAMQSSDVIVLENNKQIETKNDNTKCTEQGSAQLVQVEVYGGEAQGIQQEPSNGAANIKEPFKSYASDSFDITQDNDGPGLATGDAMKAQQDSANPFQSSGGFNESDMSEIKLSGNGRCRGRSNDFDDTGDFFEHIELPEESVGINVESGAQSPLIVGGKNAQDIPSEGGLEEFVDVVSVDVEAAVNTKDVESKLGEAMQEGSKS